MQCNTQCDEIRPICGQCAKKGRECKESPRPDLNWVTSGQLYVPSTHTNLEATFTLELELEPAFKELSLVKSTVASTGASFHKYRICTKPTDIPRTPPLTSIDQLRHDFSVANLHCPLGHRLSAFSSRFDEVPRYLGQSSTLDQAARCLIYSHQSLLVRDNQCDIDSSIYHKALRDLQSSLNDPLRVASSTTLCAVSLLGCAELLGNKFLNWNYINHASGLVTLIETNGLAAAQDDLGKLIIYSAVGQIVSWPNLST